MPHAKAQRRKENWEEAKVEGSQVKCHPVARRAIRQEILCVLASLRELFLGKPPKPPIFAPCLPEGRPV